MQNVFLIHQRKDWTKFTYQDMVKANHFSPVSSKGVLSFSGCIHLSESPFQYLDREFFCSVRQLICIVILLYIPSLANLTYTALLQSNLHMGKRRFKAHCNKTILETHSKSGWRDLFIKFFLATAETTSSMWKPKNHS